MLNNFKMFSVKKSLSFFLKVAFYRKIFLIILDCISIFLSLYVLKIILNNNNQVYNYFSKENLDFGKFFLIGLILFIPSYIFSGQYSSLTRYLGSISLYKLAFRNLIIILGGYFLSSFFRNDFLPLVYPFILWILITTFSSTFRLILRDGFLVIRQKYKSGTKVAIYGAGSAGTQLSNSLKLSKDFQIIVFIDDSDELKGQNINGIPIVKLTNISAYKSQIDQILLAMPSLNNKQRRKVISSIRKYNLPVLQIPSIDELANGIKSIDTVERIRIEDLLSRPDAKPIDELLTSSILDKHILITGAGGSIGGQLCREVIKLNPSSLIMIDSSEENLYLIEQEIGNLANKNINVFSILGNVCDEKFIYNVFTKHKVDTVFHSAAYKHVPLVEFNPISGIANNYKSTRTIAKASIEFGVNKFTLISSDKAVRPTNIMGASKRLSELIIQAYAKEQDKIKSVNNNKTIFSMVRFGNVLGSSGSVVKLFTRQIKKGGPISLTHPEMERYFMTIKEAAQLVIQSSSFSKGGDLFLLDMGEPVKIKDLAEQMIYLSGLKLKENNIGDIEIVCTGLRPGEKLYEELLIDAKSIPTKHPLIFKANEKFIEPNILWRKLEVLDKDIDNYNLENTLYQLSELIKEWQKSDIYQQ